MSLSRSSRAGPCSASPAGIAGQLVFGRCGLAEYQKLLDYPITPGEGKVLYLAMDRLKPIGRPFRRMVGEAMRAELDERLTVWKGAPPHDLAKYPSHRLGGLQHRAAFRTRTHFTRERLDRLPALESQLSATVSNR